MKSSSSENKVQAEQLALLYHNSPLPVAVSMFVAAVLCWSQWGVSNHFILLAWFTASIAISATRMVVFFLFSRHDSRSAAGNILWNNLFLAGTLLSATAWGGAAFLIFPATSPLHQMIFTVIIAGLSAGAISSLCPSWPAVSSYLVLTLSPLAARFMTLNDQNSLFIGTVILLFLATTLLGSKRLHDSITENLGLRRASFEREKVLKASEERYRHFFSNAPLGIFHYDASGTIVDCNDIFAQIIGSSRQRLIGLKMLSTLRDDAMLEAIRRSLTLGEGYYEGDYASVTAKKITPIRVFFSPVRSTDQTIIGGIGIVEDFTERKLTEEQVRYYSSYDPLTGLPNRRLLLEHLSRELSRAARHGRNGALLFVDLDNFKTVNESLGHSIGDKLLRLAADRISDSLRQEDTAARMGGDEYVIILPDLNDRIELAAKKSQLVAEKLSSVLATPFCIDGHDLHVTPSIGISLFPTEGKGVDDILKQADTAMYKAKAAGRNTIRFFLPSMQQAADERLRLNTELRKALANDEFSIHLQPQVRIDGEIIGAEALLRWHHPERGMVPPFEFIPVAEESGIIHEIGHWVLLETCRKVREWSDAGMLTMRQTIAVNISPREFSAPDFVDSVISVLRETGADPRQLDFELTEGSLICNVSDTIEKINTLRQLGITFSVDDFGTGYSSLSYLKRLPLNTLKIDRSFVRDIGSDPNDTAIVETIIMMAHSLGMNVIAEGVETHQELDYLSSKGCEVYQGYYFSRPLPVKQFLALLQSGLPPGDRDLAPVLFAGKKMA